ncbi:hypothetical protein NL676_015124 [Syzygium grande]|nr:hypothetical protein NL676_015124 [Syzygium grande]
MGWGGRSRCVCSDGGTRPPMASRHRSARLTGTAPSISTRAHFANVADGRKVGADFTEEHARELAPDLATVKRPFEEQQNKAMNYVARHIFLI